MSDLVKRLRDERDKARISAANYAEFNHEWRRRAEAITTERDELKAKLAKAVGALGDIYDGEPEWPSDPQKELDWCRNRAKRAIAELKGHNDE